LHLYQRNAKFKARPLGSLFTKAAVQEGVLTLVKFINTGVMGSGRGKFTDPDPRRSLPHAEIQGRGSVDDGENFQRPFHFKNEATKLVERCKMKLCTSIKLCPQVMHTNHIFQRLTYSRNEAAKLLKGSKTVSTSGALKSNCSKAHSLQK
jgi:hypothetical protein